MTTEQVPVHNLQNRDWREPSIRFRNQWQGWQQSLYFPLRLPLVLWWAVLLVTVAFGSFLNVHMSSRISDARLQLARLEDDLTTQEEINSELLFRIGQEIDLNHVAIWAQNHGFQYRSEMLWLDQETSTMPTTDNANPIPQDPMPELVNPATRFQGALDTLGGIALDFQVEISGLWHQIAGFTPMPPETRRSNNRVEVEEEGLLGELWKYFLEAINA